MNGIYSSFILATFHVQSIDVSQNNEYVAVTCIFARNSPATGCLVKFNGSMEINMIKSNNNLAVANVTLEEGEYDMSVFDIVGGEASTLEADSTRISRTISVTKAISTSSGYFLGLYIINMQISLVLLTFL